MTPGQIAALIPDEVVEAVAEAMWDEVETSPWAFLSETTQRIYRDKARASIAAGLSTWPGKDLYQNEEMSKPWLILPLKERET